MPQYGRYPHIAATDSGTDNGRRERERARLGRRQSRRCQRARRTDTVHAIAVRSAERAVATGERVELEPMSAVERKLVHERLQDYPGVSTASEGNEPNRYVVVFKA